jgi:aromatic aminotransferase
MSVRFPSACLIASCALYQSSAFLPARRPPPLFPIRLYQSSTSNKATAATTRPRTRMASSPSQSPPLPSKIQTTLDPCVVLMKDLISKFAHQWDDKGGIYSLAQGVVYWKPPDVCNTALAAAITDPHSALHLYGPNEGLAELLTELHTKIATKNSLTNQYIMVTAGANQAYTNCVLTLLDNTTDRAVVFAPYYFNHVMALQMTIGNENIVVGPTLNDTGEPDLIWLEQALEQDARIRMVTLTNPNNPTGTALSRSFCQRLVDLTRKHICWLIFDCTYEDFTTSEEPFDCCFNDEEHCLHIFSFSKAYALAGYRCGYVTSPNEHIYNAMMKVQDTVPIAPSRISQVAALAALQNADDGQDWVKEKVDTLKMGREAILDALQCLPQIMGGNGAMYVMGKLPVMNDREIAERLVRDYGVAVIPGEFCGAKGWIRVCYANLPPDKCTVAAQRLADGLRDIVKETGR